MPGVFLLNRNIVASAYIMFILMTYHMTPIFLDLASPQSACESLENGRNSMLD